jgi:hypothetical protein
MMLRAGLRRMSIAKEAESMREPGSKRMRPQGEEL